MSGSIAPQWLLQFFDDVGNIASGAKLYSYVAGTTEPTPLYADYACTTPLANPYSANAAGRANVWLKNGISYRLRVEDADGNVLCDRWPIIGGTSITAESLRDIVGDSEDITWALSPDGTTLIGSVVPGDGDTYKVKVDSDDAAPGFLEDKLADTTDTQFTPTEDGSQLDNIVYQLTGLGTRLNRVKDAGFDFERGPFPQANYAGGRGISFGRRFVAGVEVDTWVTQANNGKLYWTSNNDASRWKVVDEDLSVYTTLPNDRAHYGWSCIQFVYVAGTHNCFCWVMGSGDNERHITFVEHKTENYNADGTFKASALDGVTYPVGTGPYTPIDIMQADTSGGIFIAGDDTKVGFTTDLENFQLAVTADHNVGGLGFDGENTVQVIERDYGVIWRSTNLGTPGTFSKVATLYLDDVPVSHFPMSQPGGTAAQWGSMFSMYGQWLSINFRYVAGGIGFIYSDDGIYWYSSRDEATPFYDANNDGLRWFATNAVPNSGTPIFQLIVSTIPVHRRMSLEKGAVVSGPLILRELPNLPILGTDHRGRIIDGTAELSGYFVDLATNQTVDGVKTFSDGVVADSLKITNQAGPVARMVQAGTDGTQSAVSAATARATIGALAASEKGAANGVAPLGADSKISSIYLPSYVDDVLEYANLAAFPATGESGKIYVALDTNKTYRWSGSAYVVISETLALGETSSTAYRGDRGATAYTHSQATGNPHGTTYAQLASIPAALDAIDGLTPAADRLAYYTGANGAELATLSAFGRSLIDDADAAAARTTLGAASSSHNHDAAYLGISANAVSATKLATARTLTIGGTSKTFDGSANVSWTLAEIGAQAAGSYAAASHSHAIADVTSLQTELDSKLESVTADATSRAANTVYAAPNGAAGTAVFRSLVAADIPSLDTSKLTSGTLGYARGGTGISAPGSTAGNLRWSGSAYMIDTASYALASAVPAASSTTPAALGTAAVGTGTTWARADHVHMMPTAAQVGAAASGHNHTLDSLSNVTITSNAAGEILKWSGTAWVNSTLSEAGIQPAGSYASSTHSHAISDVANLQTALDGKEAVLGNPATNGYILSSTTAGVRSWVPLPTIPVTSVFGRTGAVVAASGDYTTAQVTESGNLYYTDARARAAISASAPLSYSGGVVSHLATDGNLHVPATSTTNNGKALVAGSTAGSIAWTSLAISHITSLQTTLDAKMAAASYPDLVAIEALAGTSGLLRKTAANTWSLDTASYALSSAIPVASSTTPSALGTAAVGTGTTWARADHVHAMPTAAQVGAAAASHSHAIADVTALQSALDGKQATLGYTPVNKAGDTMTGPLTLESTTGNARLAMSKDAIRVFEKGMFSIDNTVRESVYDDAGAWIDDVISYARPAGGTVNIGGLGATRRDVNLTKDLKLDGTVRISSGGAGSLTTLATTGPATLAQATVSDLTTGRMVSTTTGGRLQALDAAGSRALIGAQAALGYTPANRAGDTFSGQVVVTDPTNVVAQPKLLVSVGGGAASGEVGFHSDGASVGNKNWSAGVSRDYSCFRILSYDDNWSVLTECIRVGTDYLDLSNSSANALAVGYKIGGLKVVGGRKIGWGAPTGTATRTTFATSTVTLQQLAERVKALLDDLISHGLIGA